VKIAFPNTPHKICPSSQPSASLQVFPCRKGWKEHLAALKFGKAIESSSPKHAMQDTLDLFPDEPKPTPSMLELVALQGIKLSPAQKAFKQLVANIEALELRIKETAALVDTYRPQLHKKLRPLQDERDKLNQEMVLFLDGQLSKKGWASNHRKTMKEIVCALAEQLFATSYGEEMTAIFNRHSEFAADELPAMNRAAFAAKMEDEFGLDLGTTDGEPRSDDELFQETLRQVEEHMREQAEKAEAYAASRRGNKHSAKQKKTAQQAVDAGKLLKEIYRKLTSLLHPDREPDEAERLRKTALMSEANKAYESKNLLKLLQLQLQAGKIDSLSAAALADEKLQLINHTLREQFSELKLEHDQLEMIVRDEFDVPFYAELNAATLQKVVSAATAAEKDHNKIMRSDLVQIKRNDASLKVWLKEQREMMQDDESLDDIFGQAMMDMPKRRR